MHEKHFEMSGNDDHTSWYLLDYLYHQKYYKLIGIDFLRQTNRSTLKEISFVGKLEEEDGTVALPITEKQQKPILNFSLDSLIVTK